MTSFLPDNQEADFDNALMVSRPETTGSNIIGRPQRVRVLLGALLRWVRGIVLLLL